MEMLFRLKGIKHNTNKKLVFFNAQQLALLQLKAGQNVTLAVGETEFSVKVAKQRINNSIETIYFNSRVKTKLLNYRNHTLNLIAVFENKLVLGSTLGVAVTKRVLSSIDTNSTIREKAMLAKSKGILFYCFSIHRVDWKNNIVHAYVFKHNTCAWAKVKVPVPKVIYYRGNTPPYNSLSITENSAIPINIKWINSIKAFGKWETYNAVKSFTDTAEYMPSTTNFTLANLEDFMSRYQYCYAKGNRGSSGREVYRIEVGANCYICKTGGSNVSSYTFSKLNDLYEFLTNSIGKHGIIQQGIELAQINNSPFDMRVLVQKDINHNWLVSALNFRIAQPGAIVTNFAAGATDILKMPGEDLILPYLNWESITDFSIKTVFALEAVFGNLGEVGIDIALDANNRLWLIEANSKPNSIAYRNADIIARKQIFGLPLDYSIALTKSCLGVMMYL